MAKKQTTQSGRVFFTSGDDALPLPDLIAHQKDSWRDFVEGGLSEIFSEINPIDDYTGQKLALRFGSYRFDEPKTTDIFAKENNRLILAYLTRARQEKSRSNLDNRPHPRRARGRGGRRLAQRRQACF